MTFRRTTHLHYEPKPEGSIHEIRHHVSFIGPGAMSLMVGASGVELYTEKEKAESWYDAKKDPSAKKGTP